MLSSAFTLLFSSTKRIWLATFQIMPPYEVKLLLNNGADVNAQGGEFANALCAASAEGHPEVVRRLLYKGAHMNAEGGFHGKALYAALARDHQEVVKILLDEGADVNAQGGEYAML